MHVDFKLKISVGNLTADVDLYSRNYVGPSASSKHRAMAVRLGFQFGNAAELKYAVLRVEW